ncbi:MAG: condensation domain-containing protein, partial [Actinomycetota bacterium]|nr:condensation domain-containing protein [Actinomycetota bacterium]
RYLTEHGPALAAAPPAEVAFNYLGQFDQTVRAARRFTPSDDPTGPDTSPAAERAYLLELDVSVINGQLRMYWTYSPASLRPETVEALAERYRTLVGELAEPAVERYPLVPVQRAMLDRIRHAPRYGQYLYQWTVELREAIDPDRFQRAWADTVRRHSALRTAIVPGAEPAQEVRPDAVPAIRWLDHSHLPKDEQERAVTEYLREVQSGGLDLGHAPVLDLAVARTGPRRAVLLATFSLLVLDVPSFGLVLDEVLARYADPASLPRTAHPYREYVDWVAAQDLTAAREFWRAYLSDVEQTPVLPSRPAATRPRAYTELAEWLSQEDTDALHAFARRHRVTLNAVLQCVWARCLHERTGSADVVFGAIVSGRPAALDDPDDRVGRFVNFLPVRLRVPSAGTFADWVVAAQSALFEVLRWPFLSEEQIREWCGLAPYRHLYQSLAAWEVAPLRDVLTAPHWRPAGEVTIVQDPEIPLKLTGTLFERLRLSLAYLPEDVPAATATALFGRAVALLVDIARGRGLEFPIDNQEEWSC